MIPEIYSVEDLTDESLLSLLDSKSEKSNNTVTESDLAKLFETVVKIDISIKSAKGRIKLFFMA